MTSNVARDRAHQCSRSKNEQKGSHRSGAVQASHRPPAGLYIVQGQQVTRAQKNVRDGLSTWTGVPMRQNKKLQNPPLALV